MLVAEKLVFVELHRTGASKLQKLLAEVAGAEHPEKVTASAEALAARGLPVIGYVSDPLAWYYFLWKQGCAGKGDLHKRLTDPARWSALAAKLATQAQERGKSGPSLELPSGWGADHAKGVWYASSENPAAFREWLRAVLKTRSIRRLVSPAYSHSPVQKFAGLMTHEYFSTFVRGFDKVDAATGSHEALWALNEAQAITPWFVRAESTSADLEAVLSKIGITLTEQQWAAARALDKAGRQKQVDAFYNDEARGWVLESDAVMARLFGRGAAASQRPAEPAALPAPSPAVAASPAPAGEPARAASQPAVASAAQPVEPAEAQAPLPDAAAPGITPAAPPEAGPKKAAKSRPAPVPKASASKSAPGKAPTRSGKTAAKAAPLKE